MHIKLRGLGRAQETREACHVEHWQVPGQAWHPPGRKMHLQVPLGNYSACRCQAIDPVCDCPLAASCRSDTICPAASAHQAARMRRNSGKSRSLPFSDRPRSHLARKCIFKCFLATIRHADANAKRQRQTIDPACIPRHCHELRDSPLAASCASLMGLMGQCLNRSDKACPAASAHQAARISSS